jgi:dihydroxyacid dehydratase/phosphogluconate dehydratase
VKNIFAMVIVFAMGAGFQPGRAGDAFSLRDGDRVVLACDVPEVPRGSELVVEAAIDDEALDVTPDHVLVLRNAGPQGGPGMPEWGMLPMPKKLLKQGHRDMVRLSDARMSGTSYGACILHVSPESYVGGPLALVRNGDRITLDVAARTINLDVPEAELEKRRAA